METILFLLTNKEKMPKNNTKTDKKSATRILVSCLVV